MAEIVRKFLSASFVLIVCCFIGCVPIRKYSGLEPVYPAVGLHAKWPFISTVDSLQPEFRWEASPTEGTT